MDSMDIDTLSSKTTADMNTLFQNWEEVHKKKGYERFIRDGIVSLKDWYEQTTPKICYLLKEAYSDRDGFDLVQTLHDEDPWQMWKKVAVWTEAIFQSFGECSAYDKERVQKNSWKNTDCIAVINIKKSNGQSQSDDKEIVAYAEADQDFLRRELDIINPDIILCGNTSDCLRTILGDRWKDNETKMTLFGQWNGKLVIDYCHPASQYPNRINYYALMSICQIAKRKYGFLQQFVHP